MTQQFFVYSVYEPVFVDGVPQRPEIHEREHSGTPVREGPLQWRDGPFYWGLAHADGPVRRFSIDGVCSLMLGEYGVVEEYRRTNPDGRGMWFAWADHATWWGRQYHGRLHGLSWAALPYGTRGNTKMDGSYIRGWMYGRYEGSYYWANEHIPSERAYRARLPDAQLLQRCLGVSPAVAGHICKFA